MSLRSESCSENKVERRLFQRPVKDAVLERSEWIERVRRQFDEVLQTRPVTVDWYIEHANADLGDEETLYRYLKEVYDYVFSDGPWPVTEG